MPTIQDYIDDIDPTKPINPPVLKSDSKVSSGSVRANFLAIKNALQSILNAGSGAMASETEAGIVEFADSPETIDGLINNKSVHPVGLWSALNNWLTSGLATTFQPLLGYTAENAANKGAADGYCDLVSGKVPASRLPDSITGAMSFQTVWNATTNNPAIPAASSGNKGYYWVVQVAGSTNVSGIVDWKVGDWLVSDGASFQKIDNTDSVSSVNGQLGAVTLTTSNLEEGTNLYHREDRVLSSILSTFTGSTAGDPTTGNTQIEALQRIWGILLARLDSYLPKTGATGDVLTKTADGASWQTASGGGGGGSAQMLIIDVGRVRTNAFSPPRLCDFFVTLSNTISGATADAGSFTLPEGTYHITFTAGNFNPILTAAGLALRLSSFGIKPTSAFNPTLSAYRNFQSYEHKYSASSANFVSVFQGFLLLTVTTPTLYYLLAVHEPPGLASGQGVLRIEKL